VLRPRLALLLHVGTQHRIDPTLIASACLLELVENVFIDADRNRLLFRWDDQDGLGPVDILKPLPIRIIGNGGFNFLIGEGSETRPVRFALAALKPAVRMLNVPSPRDATCRTICSSLRPAFARFSRPFVCSFCAMSWSFTASRRSGRDDPDRFATTRENHRH
jgi:hypothetical protein